MRNVASVLVRKLDDAVYERLRIRAAAHGVSIEEEARHIIERSVAVPEHLGKLAVECFGPGSGVELELPTREPHEPIGLAE